MIKKPKILVVGSLVMDLIASTSVAPKSGETVIGMNFSTAPGGKGANQAVQCARLGAEVCMVGKVGDDAYGKILTDAVSAAGADVSHVQVEKGISSGVGHITLEVTPSGVQNRITVCPGANHTVTVEDVAWLKESIADFDIVMMQFEIPMEVVEAVAEWARDAGVTVMINPAPAAPISDKLLSCATYISPNEHEAAALANHPIDVSNGVNASDVEAVAKAFRARGVENLIITLGENGSVIAGKNGIDYVECVKAPCVVDPTAAGDSFVAGFCTGIGAGLSQKDALVFASHVAAITVSRKGAMPSLPTIEEVKNFMQERGCVLEDLDALAHAEQTAPKNASDVSVENFFAHVDAEMNAFLHNRKPEEYAEAFRLITESQAKGGRIHVTGIGKCSHVATYVASLLSSTGNPAYYLHGTEAVHGSCGQLVAGDVVIAISNSGETSELVATVNAVKNNGCKTIGVSGNADSWLAKNTDAFLFAGVKNEGGPMNRAPRNSVLAELLTLQALSVALQTEKDWDPVRYVRCHPGGALGAIRANEK